MVMRTMTVVFLLSLAPGAMRAQAPTRDVNDGNALQRECVAALQAAEGAPVSGRDPLERGSDMGQCLGLVAGVWHTHMMMVDEFNSRAAFCPSASITA